MRFHFRCQGPTSGWIGFRWASRDLATTNPSQPQGNKKVWKGQVSQQTLRSRHADLHFIDVVVQVGILENWVRPHHCTQPSTWPIVSSNPTPPTRVFFLSSRFSLVVRILKVELVFPLPSPDTDDDRINPSTQVTKWQERRKGTRGC